MLLHDSPAAFLPEFGEAITRADGSSFAGLFDLRYVDPLGVAGSNPRLTAPMTSPVLRDAVLTIRGQAYRVQTVEPDGTGWYAAELQRQ